MDKKTKMVLVLGLVVMVLIGGGAFSLTMISINKIWPVEKYFDNPWATNNGTPRILQSNQIQSSISETSNTITIPDKSEVIGTRIEYRITYLDGSSNLPDAFIDFNGFNVAAVRFLSRGQVITGTATISSSLLASSNQITIRHTGAYGGWNKLSYDAVLVLGYNAEPDDDPGQGGGGGDSSEDIWGWLLSYTLGIQNLYIIIGALLLIVILRR